MDYRIKPALIWNRECGIDREPELSQADNVGEIEILKVNVVRNIETDSICFLARKLFLGCKTIRTGT